MTDLTVTAIVVSIPTTISAILNFIIQYRQSRNHLETAKQLEELKVTTNGKMEELLRITGTSEHAKGVLEGKKEG